MRRNHDVVIEPEAIALLRGGGAEWGTQGHVVPHYELPDHFVKSADPSAGIFNLVEVCISQCVRGL